MVLIYTLSMTREPNAPLQPFQPAMHHPLYLKFVAEGLVLGAELEPSYSFLRFKSTRNSTNKSGDLRSMPLVMNCAKRLSFGRRSCCGQMTKASPHWHPLLEPHISRGKLLKNSDTVVTGLLPRSTSRLRMLGCESRRLNTSTLASPPGNTPDTGSWFQWRLPGKQHWIRTHPTHRRQASVKLMPLTWIVWIGKNQVIASPAQGSDGLGAEDL